MNQGEPHTAPNHSAPHLVVQGGRIIMYEWHNERSWAYIWENEAVNNHVKVGEQDDGFAEDNYTGDYDLETAE